MRVTAIARARNEADIVEAWARHALGHVDRLVVQVECEDDTAAILRALAAEGLPVEVLDESAVGDVQAVSANDLMRREAEACDWIVPLDADEFPCGPEPLRETLAKLDRRKVYKHRWRTYVYKQIMLGNAEGFLPLGMAQRLRREVNPDWSKVIVPAKLVPNVSLSKGAHLALGAEQHDADPVLHLAHFPIRSPHQWMLKSLVHHLNEIAAGWEATRPINTHPAVRSMLDNGYISHELCEETSASYFAERPEGWNDDTVLEPLAYLGGPLRYTRRNGDGVDAGRGLARVAEKFAREVARLRGHKTKAQDDRFNSAQIFMAPKV